MGVDGRAIVYNECELRERVAWVIQNYHQPALVEDYLPGREFTIGVLGRQDAAHYSLHPEWYDNNGFHRFPTLEIDNNRSATPGVYGHFTKTLNFSDEGVPGFICPANVSDELGQNLHDLAVRAHCAIGALDVSRVDMRMDRYGRPCLVEINSLPGMSPGFSDLCVIAKAEGITYQELILEILQLGASRFGLLEPAERHVIQLQKMDLFPDRS